ncbi:MAG: UDP-glucose 4-epimerase, partial [Bacteroidota bacterium]|nr:UDP-glucose 4-epimerase [Bacteroidota bacterium]
HIEALKKGGESETFNISTGIETDVNSLFSMLSKITTGGKATVQYADARKGEQKRSVCSAAKAEEVLGWRPAVKLEDGLRSTVEYFQKALA